MQNSSLEVVAKNGQAITFYSYKGGVGRTMALVNIACLLAKENKKLLLVDCDLEAPGLHQFFDIIGDSGGFVDLITDATKWVSIENNNDEEGYCKFFEENIDSYIAKDVKPKINESNISIDIMKAGRFDKFYSEKLNSIDWIDFYKHSPAFFRTFAISLEREYDYIFVDARTGLADTSGICTMLIPQKLVLVFALNNQNITGVVDIAGQSIDYRLSSNDYRPLRIYPLPSRIENSVNPNLQQWIDNYKEKFELLFTEKYLLDECNLTAYFNRCFIQYYPIHAYGENIPSIYEEVSSSNFITYNYYNFLMVLEKNIPSWEVVNLEDEIKLEKIADESKIKVVKESEEEIRKALEIDEKLFGSTDPKIATHLNNLAGFLYERNRFEEAEPLLRRALKIDEKNFNRNHTSIARDLSNLAQLLYVTNRLREAESLMRKALEINIENFGENHPNITRDLNNLAELLRFTNRLQEAEPLMRKALEIDEQNFGENHPNVARDLNNLAQLLQATNRLQEAEPLMRKALEIDKQNFGENHPNVARDLNNLAQLLKATNRFKEAEFLMREVIDIYKDIFGENHPNTSVSLNNLAELLLVTNRLQEAEPLMRKSLEINQQSFGDNHPNVAIRLNNLAALLQRTSRLQEAEPLMKEALEIDINSFGENHPNVARDFNNLAQLLRDTNRLQEAELLMKKALEIDRVSFGENHPNVATDLNNLAKLLQDTNRLQEAEPLMKKALIIFLASFDSDHPNIQTVGSNYVSILQQIGKSDEEIKAILDELLK